MYTSRAFGAQVRKVAPPATRFAPSGVFELMFNCEAAIDGLHANVESAGSEPMSVLQVLGSAIHRSGVSRLRRFYERKAGHDPWDFEFAIRARQLAWRECGWLPAIRCRSSASCTARSTPSRI